MKTILLALDGSPLSESVLPTVEAIAGGAGYKVVLFSVWEVLPEELADVGEVHARELRDQGKKHFRAYLSNIANILAQRGIDATAEVRAGHPAIEIMAAAVELDVDMVAMATHGRQGVTLGRRGSVADKVLRGSTVPILILGPRALEAWPPAEIAIRSILVPLDGSRESEAALPLAAELADKLQAPTALLRVVPPILGHHELEVHSFSPSEIDKKRRRAAIRYLKGQQGRYPELIQEVCVETGLPRQEILRFIEQHGCDLVILASRSRYSPGRWSLGGVADAVIDGRASVILVPPFGE